MDSFWASLIGYAVRRSAIAGGGGSVGTNSLYLDFQLHNPATGRAVATEHAMLTIVADLNRVLEIVRIPLNEESESYPFALRSLVLVSSDYSLYIILGGANASFMSMGACHPEDRDDLTCLA